MVAWFQLDGPAKAHAVRGQRGQASDLDFFNRNPHHLIELAMLALGESCAGLPLLGQERSGAVPRVDGLVQLRSKHQSTEKGHRSDWMVSKKAIRLRTVSSRLMATSSGNTRILQYR